MVLTILLISSLTLSTSAFAADSKNNEVDITVESGEMSIKTSDIDSFGNITLKEGPEKYQTSFKNNFTVKDLTGEHEGWKISLSASQFADGSKTLPKGSLTMLPVKSVDRVGEGSGGEPKISMSSNQIIDDGSIEVLKANSGAGMGVFTFRFAKYSLEINIDPTTAKIGNYQSTLTWDLVQAP